MQKWSISDNGREKKGLSNRALNARHVGDSQVVLSKEEGCSLPGVGNVLVNVGDKVLPDLNKQAVGRHEDSKN